jgi:hypothetical protein
MEVSQLSQLSSAPNLPMSALAQPESGSCPVVKTLEFPFTVRPRRRWFIPDGAMCQWLELCILSEVSAGSTGSYPTSSQSAVLSRGYRQCPRHRKIFHLNKGYHTSPECGGNMGRDDPDRNFAFLFRDLAQWMAEGAGFEPAIRFPVYTLSRRAPSTTRPPLQHEPLGLSEPSNPPFGTGRSGSPLASAERPCIAESGQKARPNLSQFSLNRLCHCDKTL